MTDAVLLARVSTRELYREKLSNSRSHKNFFCRGCWSILGRLGAVHLPPPPHQEKAEPCQDRPSSCRQCPHELRGDLRDDGVTRAAQCAHAVGYPISQRENAGFNAPGFSV